MKKLNIIFFAIVIIIPITALLSSIFTRDYEKENDSIISGLEYSQIEYVEILPILEQTAYCRLTLQSSVEIRDKQFFKILTKAIKKAYSKRRHIASGKWVAKKHFRLHIYRKEKDVICARITIHISDKVASFDLQNSVDEIFTRGGKNIIQSEVLYNALTKTISDNGLSWVNAFKECWNYNNKQDLIFAGCKIQCSEE